MKIICIGRNYVDHAKEMKADIPTEPVFFLKPDTALSKDNLFYYPEFTKELHYEVEVVLRIEKHGKHVAKEHASNYYSKVGLGIDFTARDVQKDCKQKGLPWEKAKAFDNAAHMSKELIELKDLPENFEFSLKKNGQLVQTGNTSELLFDFDALICYLSQFITLKQGDLIYTGTPSGVGPVQIEDVLEGFIEENKMFELIIK